jgi:hypothetical protein
MEEFIKRAEDIGKHALSYHVKLAFNAVIVLMEVKMLDIPPNIWKQVENHQRWPEEFFGRLAYLNFPHHGQAWWERASDSQREGVVRRVILRRFLNDLEPGPDFGEMFLLSVDEQW